MLQLILVFRSHQHHIGNAAQITDIKISLVSRSVGTDKPRYAISVIIEYGGSALLRGERQRGQA